MTVERVNYYNGERLEAADLLLDQSYHITLRRLVNRGFFSPGVVQGLTITTSNPTTVTLAAGFALDPQGREIVLTRHQKIAVPNHTPSSGIGGYYLTIRYHEARSPGPSPDCAPTSASGPPSRIDEAPVLGWTELWPDHNRCAGESTSESTECAIVLALVLLDGSCHVTGIDTGVREIAHSTLPGAVKSFQIEGEKDIIPGEGKRIHFRVRGGIASNVILQLWSGAFSSLYYTELARHSHGFVLSKAATSDETPAIQIGHTHHIDAQTNNVIVPPRPHGHTAKMGNFPPWVPGMGVAGSLDPFPTWTDEVIAPDPGLFPPLPMVIPATDTKTSSLTTAPSHKHTLDVNTTTDAAGNIAPYTTRDGAPAYMYIDSLAVKVDGKLITPGIVPAKATWNGTLGDGTAGHPFVTDGEGTGPVYINHLKSIGPGLHTLDLIVGPTKSHSVNGGKIMWSLTVE
jgi:hypothetical protein